MCEKLPANVEVNLPSLPSQIASYISSVTDVLGVPRAILASDEEIAHAWQSLPREIRLIPSHLRDELIARMCVAVSTGLFDSAVSYVWNATILNLRRRMQSFGLDVVSQMQHKQFEASHLIQLRDHELLTLCLQLNLISEEGYFFLDQCRAVRNNFSAAHPAIGNINDREFITFVNRCVRYALADEFNPVGVDVVGFIDAVKNGRFDEDQQHDWIGRLAATHDAQRQFLFVTLHGIFCDPASPEPARTNALVLCSSLSAQFTSTIKSDLIDQHSAYLTKGDTQRLSASRIFFERIGLLSLLNAPERHSIMSSAIQHLWNVHLGMNNFYNEPPFAERLASLSAQEAMPETVQERFVQTVVGCYIGNGYGVSFGAINYYEAMIKAFSPREISIFVSLDQGDGDVARRIQSNQSCRAGFGAAVRLLDPASVPAGATVPYSRLRRALG